MSSRPSSVTASVSPGPDLVVGSQVTVAAGPGIIRWTGTNPPFAKGRWVGVELFGPDGKNDGSVADQSYFSCRPKYGVFVRPSQVTVTKLPHSRPSSSASSSTTGLSSTRPSLTTTSRTPFSRTPSHISNATTNSRSASPQKPTSRPSAPPTLATRPSSSNLHQPPSTGSSSRQSISPLPPVTPFGKTPLKAAPLPSTAARLGSIRTTASSSSSLFSAGLNQNLPPKLRSVGRTTEVGMEAEDKDEEGDEERARRSVLESPSKHQPRLPLPRPTSPLDSQGSDFQVPSPPVQPLRFSRLSPPNPTVPLPSTQRGDGNQQAVQQGLLIRDQGMEELRIKLRVLEAKRTEEVEKLRILEGKVREGDELKRAVAIMQSKIQTLQTELTHFRLTTSTLESHNASLEARLQDTNDQLEMATLDREMAEERAESLEAELEQEKEKVVDLEVVVETLKARNDEYEQPVDVGAGGERSSLAFIQLEKHNERLKDALLRLRDLTNETDRENRTRIVELEKDLAQTSGLQSQFEIVQSNLENAELQVEDLKIQLDDALGAEEMLELLTEKNLVMGEKLEEMRIAIEELEDLKELNDELEENHLETEKQLEEEIDIRESLYKQQVRKTEDLEDLVLDHQGTIFQFRELVMELQAELESLREQHASQLSSTQDMSSHSQSVLNLNLKLQSTVAKAQSKAIDLELLKLYGAQATEHLAILQTYLPRLYFETDSDATNCVLFFDRLAQKTHLMNFIIGQNQNLPEDLYAASSDTLVITCEMRGKLSHFSLLNQRFAAILKRCSPELYTKASGIYHELSAVEKRVDGYIDLLRKDEFRDGDCMGDLVKYIAQYEHLEEAYFQQSDLDLGERELDMVLGFDYDLDNFSAAVGFAKHAVVTASQDSEIIVETGGSSLDEAVYAPIDHLLELVKSVKLASKKLVKRAEDLVQGSSALQPSLMPHLSSLVNRVSNAVDFAIQLAQRIGGYIEEIKSTKVPLQISTIVLFLREITFKVTGEVDQPWDIVAGFIASLGQEAATVWPMLMEQENVIKKSGTAPWLIRAENMAAQALVNVESERKVVKLSEEIRDISREIKKRDQLSQEAAVKIQLLERRVESAKQQAETVQALETDLNKVRKHERALEDALELMQAELDKAEENHLKLKQSQPAVIDGDHPLGGSSTGLGEPIGLENNLETHYLIDQIEGLKGALRYVRQENGFLKSQDLLASLRSLPPLPLPVPLPDLIPSSPTSSVSSLSSSSEEEDDVHGPVTPGRLQRDTYSSIEQDGKRLFREIATFSATPQVVDLRAGGKLSKGGGRWMRTGARVGGEIEQRRREGDRLGVKLGALRERARSMRTLELMRS